jgi:hypothetical protein
LLNSKDDRSEVPPLPSDPDDIRLGRQELPVWQDSHHLNPSDINIVVESSRSTFEVGVPRRPQILSASDNKQLHRYASSCWVETEVVCFPMTEACVFGTATDNIRVLDMSLIVEQWSQSSALPTAMFPITFQERSFDFEQTESMSVSSDEDLLLEGHTSGHQRKTGLAVKWGKLLPWFLHCVLLSVSLTFFFTGAMPTKCFSGPWRK